MPTICHIYMAFLISQSPILIAAKANKIHRSEILIFAKMVHLHTCTRSSVVWYCHFWVHKFLTLTYLATLFIYFYACGDANSSNNSPLGSVNICFEYLWYYAFLPRNKFIAWDQARKKS